MHYLLMYEVADDYISRRAMFRDAHLQKAWAAHARGELVLGGALTDPPDGAILLFKGDSPRVAEDFANNDPYVKNGLVKNWRVREWMTVAGDDPAKPVFPSTQPSTPETEPARDSAILRVWKARVAPEKAAAYFEHATQKVFPQLARIAGHRGAYLLRRSLGHAFEIVVLTLWDSMDAVRAFAGNEPDRAVVEPEVRAVLAQFDERVVHYELVHTSKGAQNP